LLVSSARDVPPGAIPGEKFSRARGEPPLGETESRQDARIGGRRLFVTEDGAAKSPDRADSVCMSFGVPMSVLEIWRRL
jgi:hypothetical protein